MQYSPPLLPDRYNGTWIRFVDTYCSDLGFTPDPDTTVERFTVETSMATKMTIDTSDAKPRNPVLSPVSPRDPASSYVSAIFGHANNSMATIDIVPPKSAYLRHEDYLKERCWPTGVSIPIDSGFDLKARSSLHPELKRQDSMESICTVSTQSSFDDNLDDPQLIVTKRIPETTFSENDLVSTTPHNALAKSILLISTDKNILQDDMELEASTAYSPAISSNTETFDMAFYDISRTPSTASVGTHTMRSEVSVSPLLSSQADDVSGGKHVEGEEAEEDDDESSGGLVDMSLSSTCNNDTIAIVSDGNPEETGASQGSRISKDDDISENASGARMTIENNSTTEIDHSSKDGGDTKGHDSHNGHMSISRRFKTILQRDRSLSSPPRSQLSANLFSPPSFSSTTSSSSSSIAIVDSRVKATASENVTSAQDDSVARHIKASASLSLQPAAASVLSGGDHQPSDTENGPASSYTGQKAAHHNSLRRIFSKAHVRHSIFGSVVKRYNEDGYSTDSCTASPPDSPQSPSYVDKDADNDNDEQPSGAEQVEKTQNSHKEDSHHHALLSSPSSTSISKSLLKQTKRRFSLHLRQPSKGSDASTVAASSPLVPKAGPRPNRSSSSPHKDDDTVAAKDNNGAAHSHRNVLINRVPSIAFNPFKAKRSEKA
ncbi:hypothetical protein H4219_002215 [Mycoemilia scoparia]|uniref:Uncharacterized protein n=1 Tax=Mycoemilia scoparia TaxID=417184 RepID=A0A9W8A1Q4_9FUNG|nr:hypothetical protein H4219_002215 [Mycoemilia scoparia]